MCHLVKTYIAVLRNQTFTGHRIFVKSPPSSNTHVNVANIFDEQSIDTELPFKLSSSNISFYQD